MMIIQFLIRAFLVYLLYLAIRKLWLNFNRPIENNRQDKGRFNRNDDIVEADFTVVDEKEIRD